MKIFKILFFPVSLVTAITVVSMAPTLSQAILLSFAVIFVSLVSVAYAETLIPINPDWSGIKKDSIADLLSVITVAGGMEGLLKWFFPIIVAFIYQEFPVIKIFNVHHIIGNLWIEAVLIIFCIEFLRYWYHRISHENYFFWKMHSSHHCPVRMYWGNSYRLNPIYHGLVSIISLLPFLLIGVDPKVFILYNTALGIMANFQHGNLVLDYGFLNKIFSTGEIHKWHHSIDLKESMNNYGALLSVFDVFFGTYYNPKNKIPQTLGITNEPWYPVDDYMKQIMVPFYWKKWKSSYRQKNRLNS